MSSAAALKSGLMLGGRLLPASLPVTSVANKFISSSAARSSEFK